jgi:hypothetical protein
MSSVLIVPKVWELLEKFKNKCKSRGWEISEYGDWVKKGDKYHNFLWTRTIHQSTFEKVVTGRRFAVREGLSYHIVDLSYAAWMFPEAPPKKLMRMITENSELSKRIAIYDLSWAYAGKPVCLKLNETDSPVFQEFEKFLEKKYRVKVQTVKS